MLRKKFNLMSPSLCLFIVLNPDLCFNCDDSLTAIMRTEQSINCFVPSQKLRARLCP